MRSVRSVPEASSFDTPIKEVEEPDFARLMIGLEVRP